MSTDPRIAARAAELRAQFPHAFDQGAPVNPLLTNLLKYAGAIALAILVGMLPGLIGQLYGTDPISWRPILADGLSALLAALTGAGIASQFPRVGSEGLASQVNDLRAAGVHRADMVVTTREAA